MTLFKFLRLFVCFSPGKMGHAAPQGEQSQRCQEVARLRTQVKETQETLHSTRQRLEQVLNERQQSPAATDTRRLSTLSPLAGRKAPQGPSAASGDELQQMKFEVQRLQRRLVEQQQGFEAERQVIRIPAGIFFFFLNLKLVRLK